jgi:hypothetical protein
VAVTAGGVTAALLSAPDSHAPAALATVTGALTRTAADVPVPVHLIPPGMLAQANDLLRQLSYPALPAPPSTDSTR